MNKNKDQRGRETRTIEKGEHNIWESIYVQHGTSRRNEKLREAVIVFVLNGKLSITSGSYKNCVTGRREAFLIPYNTEFHIEALEDSHFISCRFTADSLLAANYPVKELSALQLSRKCEFNQLKINNSLYLFLKLMEEYLENGEILRSLLEVKKTELFYLLYIKYIKADLVTFLYPILGEDIEFREFVLNNYLKISSIPQLAEMAHYSLSGFEKKFRRCFKDSPYNWIMRNKAENIRQELEMGTATFQEIAYKYKFSSYRSFLRFCQAQFGLSPSKMLKQE